MRLWAPGRGASVGARAGVDAGAGVGVGLRGSGIGTELQVHGRMRGRMWIAYGDVHGGLLREV